MWGFAAYLTKRDLIGEMNHISIISWQQCTVTHESLLFHMTGLTTPNIFSSNECLSDSALLKPYKQLRPEFCLL